ncbi:MAG: hypothetical protein GY909_18440 [Oligoflexia bacterium]|nr:hypothetical protein [Oligoflexia bacterium]
MIKLITIIIFSISMANTFSVENHICIHEHDHSNNSILDSFSDLAGAIYTCEDDYYLNKARDDFKEAFKETTKIKDTIHGISVEGTKEQIEILKGMLEEVDIGGRALPSALEEAKDCKTPLCIAKKVYKGEEEALLAMSLSKKYGVSVSGTQNKGLKEKGIEYSWSKNDLRRLKTGLSLLPNELIGLRNLKKFYITPPGYSRGEGVLAWARPDSSGGFYSMPGSITFSNRSLNKRTLFSSIHTIIHEIAHHHDYEALTDENKDRRLTSEMSEYSKLNGWTSKKVPKELFPGYTTDVDEWTGDPNSCYVTSYSKQEPAENYADTMSWYIMKPKELKAKCPKHYDYFKDVVFNGKEFESPFKHDINIGSSCLEVQKGYSIHGQNREFLGMSTLRSDEVDYRSIPNVKLNNECMDAEVAKALQDFQDTDQDYFCHLGNPEAMKDLLKKSSEERENAMNSKLIDAIKDIDALALKKECLTSNDEDCFQDQMATFIAERTGIAKDEILKGLEVRSLITLKDAEEKVGNTPLFSCLSLIEHWEKKTLKDLYDSRASIYCDDAFESHMKKAGLPIKGMNAFSLFKDYIGSKKRTEVAHQLIEIIVKAKEEIKCGFWKKKKCVSKKLRPLLEPYQEELNFDLEKVTDAELLKIYKKAN